MFMDVISAMDEARGIDRIAVLTNDTEVAGLANQQGHLVIDDASTTGLCAGLNEAVAQIARSGGKTVLIMPGDLPTVTAQDIEQLLDKHTDGLSLCPAIRDGGTNALICTPPDAAPFQFGKDSAARHLATAEQLGINTRRLPLQPFFRDIDTPDDLVWLARQTGGSHTVRFLQETGIAARLGPGHAGISA